MAPKSYLNQFYPKVHQEIESAKFKDFLLLPIQKEDLRLKRKDFTLKEKKYKEASKEGQNRRGRGRWILYSRPYKRRVVYPISLAIYNPTAQFLKRNLSN